MKTSSCKQKGRRAASEAKEKILKQYPELQDGDIIVTPSGVTGPDLIFSPHAQDICPIVVECKNQESIQIWKALEQAESHKSPGLTPTLIFKRNRSEMFIALKLEDFLNLIAGRRT